MQNWKTFSLGELGKIITGKTPKTSNPEYYGGNIPFLTPSDDMEIKHVIETKRTLTVLGKSTVKNLCLPKNSVCVSCIGSDLGKVVITTQETVSNQQINAIIVDEKFFDVDFVYYSMLILGKKLKYLSHTSTAVPIINKSNFSKCKIKVPPLEVQKKIAAVLSALDDKIELNNKINKNLEQQAQAIFKSWFIDFEPFGGKMPVDWQLKNFQSILTEHREKTTDPEIPLFSVTDNGILPREEKFHIKLSKSSTKNKIVYKGDLVFGMSRKILNFGVMFDEVGAVSSAYNVFSVDKSVSPKYLSEFIRQNIMKFSDLIRPASREGQGIDKGVLMRKQIYIPDDSTLKNFYGIIDDISTMIKNLSQENLRLAEMRDLLLPRLLNGEIDVSKVEI